MSSQSTGPNTCQPVSVHLCPHTALNLEKDQTSSPIKEEEEKGKVMPEDGHGGQWHLNSVSGLNNFTSHVLLCEWLQVNWGSHRALEDLAQGGDHSSAGGRAPGTRWAQHCCSPACLELGMPDRPEHPRGTQNMLVFYLPAQPQPTQAAPLPQTAGSDCSSTASWWGTHPSASLTTESKVISSVEKDDPHSISKEAETAPAISFCDPEAEPVWVNRKGPGTRTAWTLVRGAHRGGADRGMFWNHQSCIYSAGDEHWAGRYSSLQSGKRTKTPKHNSPQWS